MKLIGRNWGVDFEYQDPLDGTDKVSRRLIQMKTIHDVHRPTHADRQETKQRRL